MRSHYLEYYYDTDANSDNSTSYYDGEYDGYDSYGGEYDGYNEYYDESTEYDDYYGVDVYYDIDGSDAEINYQEYSDEETIVVEMDF